jgi:predicted small lipoprotein YifL
MLQMQKFYKKTKEVYMKKLIVVLFALCMVFALAACATPEPPAPPTPPVADPGEGTPPPEVTPPATEVGEYHIGIATLNMEQSEDEYRGAEDLVAKYGSVDNGGMIKWVILPSNFADEQETVITMIASFADDQLMKGVIVNQAIPGTAAAFQKIRDAGRDDMILTGNMPQDDPNVITKVADFVTHSNDFERGYYDILRAKNMGATAFVHLSFARHMAIETLSRRRNVYEEACNDLGIQWAFVNVPDPATEIGVAGAQQAVFEMMPRLVDQYGKDAVYFTTNTALHEPIIQQCLNLGAMFLNQDDVSPLMGYPGALGIDLSAEAGDWGAIVNRIEEEVVNRGGAARMGTWPSSQPYCSSMAIGELLMEIIEGSATGSREEIAKAYEVYNAVGKWSSYLDANTNTPIDNYHLITMDTYIYGKGYTGVLSEPFPEKYFDVK